MKKGFVVDFDGTFLEINSFVVYVFFLGKYCLFNFRIITGIKLLFYLFARKTKVISHSSFKYQILSLSPKFLESDFFQSLVKHLDKFVNKRVLSLVEEYKTNGYKTVVATAAPKCYVDFFKEKYKFDYSISTPLPWEVDSWDEKIRDVKYKEVQKLLKEEGVDSYSFASDHHDDLPLFQSCPEVNYLVNPSRKSKFILEQNLVEFEEVTV